MPELTTKGELGKQDKWGKDKELIKGNEVAKGPRVQNPLQMERVG